METALDRKIPESAKLADAIICEDGSIDARAMARTLGKLVYETLTGRVQSSRAHVAIRGMRTLVALADSVRRSSDDPQPLMRVTDGDGVTTKQLPPSDDDVTAL